MRQVASSPPTKLKVIPDPEHPVPGEVLASAIEAIASGVDSLFNSGLSERAILLLISDASKHPKTTVQEVLTGIQNLRKFYLKEKK